jgi:D-alanine transaminase
LIRDGMATEGAASNLFIVLNGKIITPPKNNFLLPGITRDLILELIAANAMDYAETNISESDLRDAQEVWISSSQKEVMPVTSLDGKVVGDGKPGPVWKQVHRLYQNYKQQLRSGEKH